MFYSTQKREILEILARADAGNLFLKRDVDADDSEAIKLSNLFNIGKIAGDGLSIFTNLFGRCVILIS